jgi:LCP family protein required for cell wall assembly
MADDRHDDDRPEYRVYRSRPRLLRGRDRDDGAGAVREPVREREPAPDYEVQRAGRGRRGGGRLRRPRLGRVVRWLALGVVTWLLISLVVFLVSAQIQSAKVSDAANSQLGGGGYPLTSPNTILVLGSDARAKGTKEAGATTVGSGPSRSDSILLLRIGGGRNATLSILRDTVVDIPGHGRGKVNAAYAYGGPALAVQTLEQYLGTPINHLVEVNFENFPALIDALGGIEYTGDCVVSRINGGLRNGGYTLSLKRGTHEIDGQQALALARTRKNLCRPREDDRARVRRQQKILAAIKSKVISFETFVRLPWVSWAAPKAVRSDMSGPSLLGLVGAQMIGGKGSRDVLKPSGVTLLPNGESGLVVDDGAKRDAVAKFLGG